MKHLLKVFTISLLSFSLCGCSLTSQILNKKIDLSEMKAIAKLATVECYFHNVAKSDQKTDKTWYEFWRKEKIRFWIEYEGIVKVGINADDLKIQVNNENVKVTLPKAEVLSAEIDEKSLSKKAFVYDEDTAKPTADQETKAFQTAQENMKSIAEANTTLLASAQQNAKELIKNYINSIGEVVDTKYNIEWIEK